jgi:hypothetical protein
MKNFFLNLLKFTGFAFVLYLLLLIIWGSFAPFFMKKNINYNLGAYGHMFTRLQEVKSIQNVDILFLGSSHAYRGFDPRYFETSGVTVFNLGSSAQTPLQGELLLKRHLNKLNPKLLILEVYPGTFAMDGVESSLDIISNDRNDLLSFKLILNQNHIKLYNTFFYALFRDFAGLNKNFKEEPRKELDTYISGGFVMNDLSFFEYREHEPRAWEFRTEQFKALERIIKLTQEQKIELIFIQAPITKGLFSAHTNNKDFDELMLNYGTYYNFNYLMNLDDSLHFYDAHHLNQNGVELFNAKVIEVLKNDEYLPN